LGCKQNSADERIPAFRASRNREREDFPHHLNHTHIVSATGDDMKGAGKFRQKKTFRTKWAEGFLNWI
jgi:hypothetical protein